MNDNHSRDELNYKPRWLARLFHQAIESHPVVVLTGARQVGKSTFLLNDSPTKKWDYFSLDDFDAWEKVERDPLALLENRTQVVLDEVQKTPKLLVAVKNIVDQKRRQVRFVLSGSANLLLMKQVSESLAGRAVFLTLRPMTCGEVAEQKESVLLPQLFQGVFPKQTVSLKRKTPLEQFFLQGLMPPLILPSKPYSHLSWWEGYVKSYLERDLRQLSQVDSLTDFRRFMEVFSLRTGQMLNQTEVARDCQIPQPTIYRYMRLLEVTYIIDRIPPYAKSRTKRVVKTPKVYWLDTALASYLGGVHDMKGLESAREKGAYFENFVFHHLKCLAELMVPQPKIYYWRTTVGKEIDFVLEWGRSLIALEVKLTSKLRDADTEGLRAFLQEFPGAICGIVVYTGSEIAWLDKKILALPWEYLAYGMEPLK